MEAFYQLTASRQGGMSVGPIPFEAADVYARRYGIDSREDFDEFYTLLRAVDNAYLEASRKKSNTGQQSGPKTAKDDTVTRSPRGR